MRFSDFVTCHSFSRHAAIALALVSGAILGSGNLTTQAADDATKSETISVFDKGEMKVPAEFKRTEPASRIVQHEFKVGTGDSPARLTMMGAGGSVEANIKRWKGQFSGGDEAAQKSESTKAGNWEIHLVDVNGTYAESMGGGPFAPGKIVQRENYAMIGAIMVEPEGQQYFVKLIGPADIVKSNREKFVDMIKSVGK